MKKRLLLLLILPNILFCQLNDNKEAYELFDNIVGQKNLEINTGVKYKNI